MTEHTPPFALQQVGTSRVRFPSSGPIPTIMDQAADPYFLTRMPKEAQVEGIQFWPQVKGTYPGIVVLHEAWGLNDQIKQLANRLACEGYAVIVPNLYNRQGGMVTASAEVATALAERIKDVDVLQDINACCEFLNTRDYVKRNVHAVIGYGIGGLLAMKFACQRKRLRGAVSYYSPIPIPADIFKDLLAPVLYHRAGSDETVSETDIDQLRQAATTYGKKIEVRVYPGAPHAFCNDARKDSYRADVCKEAWDTTVQFLQDCFKADLQPSAK